MQRNTKDQCPLCGSALRLVADPQGNGHNVRAECLNEGTTTDWYPICGIVIQFGWWGGAFTEKQCISAARKILHRKH